MEYYQRLEQGRATRPSDEVLDAIARVLGLGAVERNHLRSLANLPGGVVAPYAARSSAAVRPELRRMLALMDRTPALIIDDCFDVLAANSLATRLFVDTATTGPGPANLARYLFLDAGARNFYVEWDEVAAATVGQLRLSAGRHPADHALAVLICELIDGSEEFRARWTVGNVEQRTFGAKSFRHPAVGVLSLHYEHFASLADERQRLVVFTPEEHSATEAGLQLLASWATPRAHPSGVDNGSNAQPPSARTRDHQCKP